MIRLFLTLLFVYTALFSTPNNLFTLEEQQFIKEHPMVSIGMLSESKPYTYDDNGVQKGFSVDLLKEVSQISGLKFDISTNYWPVIYNKFKAGKLDIISDISYKKQREEFTLFTQSYYEIPNYIFTLKNNKSYTDNISLIGKRVAVTKSKYYNDQLQKFGVHIVEVDTALEKIDLLLKGKVDYYLTNFEQTDMLILKELDSSIQMVDTLYFINKEDLRFGIHKQKQLLHSVLQKSLDSIDKKTINNLQNKWLLFSINQKSDLLFTKEELNYIKNNPVITYSEINWRPLSIIKDGQMRGIMGDYLDLISERSGLNFKFVSSKSWSHVLYQFEQGKIDLIPGIGSSQKEQKMGLVSNEYASYPMVIVTNDNFMFVDGINELKDKTFALPKNYTSYNFIKKNYPNINIIETHDIPQALLLVESGRADAFVGHIATSLYAMSQLALKDLKVSGTTRFTFNHHYLIQPKDKLLLSIINKVLLSISEEEKSNIYSNWVNVEHDKKYDKKIVLTFIFIILGITIIFIVRQRVYSKYNRQLKEEVDSKTKELQEFNKLLESTVRRRTNEINTLYGHLKDSYEELEHILNSTMEGILISKEGIAIDCNEQFVKLFGFKNKEEIKGRCILDFVDTQYKNAEHENIQQSYKEEHESKLIKKDGSTFFALVKGNNLTQKNKTIRVSSFLDLTQMKKKEEILLEQSKMAALGEMIGNIAHQWRQPLSVISTTASGIKLKKEFGDSDIEFENNSLDSIISTTAYLSNTIDDFRNFIIGDKKEHDFYIKDVIASLINLVKPSIVSNHIQLIDDIDSNVKIRGYENEVLQSLINIINNAKDELLKLETHEKYIFITTSIYNGKVELNVFDNAGGIKQDIINKIFEPYFTTKQINLGTGIGLYMTYKILTGMDAQISVENHRFSYNEQSFEGAKFKIMFDMV